jgi:SAM-dependent methyltransferase
MERSTTAQHPPASSAWRARSRRVQIAMPPGDRVEQDVEWCVARFDGRWQEVRFHDYGRIYDVPGLYERIFYDVLQCASPQTIGGLMAEQLSESDTDPGDLRVLDLGAGNGVMGGELAAMGADHLVGVDILDEAANAAERDRPGTYADYVVANLCDLPDEERARLEDHDLNALTCVAALGFGDIPPEAFRVAYNLVAEDGWVAFNIKPDFLDGGDRSGFSRLISRVVESELLDVLVQTRYRHRDASNGDPIEYVAIVGRKTGDISPEMLDED